MSAEVTFRHTGLCPRRDHSRRGRAASKPGPRPLCRRSGSKQA